MSKREQRRGARSQRVSDAKVRLGIAIFALLGAAGAVIGIILDQSGFWSNHPFTTNVVSGTAGGCIGIAFALLVVQNFARRLAESQSRREAERIYRRGLTDLEAAARGIFSFVSDDDPVNRIIQILERIDHMLPSEKMPIRVGNTPPDVSSVIKRLPTRKAEVSEFEKQLHRYDPRLDQIRTAWANLQAQWHFFSSDVRGRVFGADLAWLSAEDYHQLQQAFGNPGKSPLESLTLIRLGCRTYVHELYIVIRQGEDIDPDGVEMALQKAAANLRSKLKPCIQRFEEISVAFDVIARNRVDIDGP